MNFLHDNILPFLGDMAAQSAKASLLACVVALLCLLPRRWLSPGWRHALWCAVFVRLVLPDIPFPGWSWNVDRLLRESIASDQLESQAVIPGGLNSSGVIRSLVAEPSPAAPSPQKQEARNSTRHLESTSPALQPIPEITAAKQFIPQKPFPSWWSLLAIVWLAGAIAWWIALGAAWWRFRRRVLARCRDAAPQTQALLEACLSETGMTMRVQLKCSEHVATPAVCGPLRPVILIPQGLEPSLPAHELRLLFLHELGHVKRRDTLVQVFVSMMLSLHWWNHMLWFAWGRLRHEAEAATDAWVLRRTGPGAAPSYGGMLLDLASRACAAGVSLLFVPSLIGATSQGKRLKQRLTAIAGHRPAGRRVGMLGMAMLIILAVAGFSQDAPAPKPGPEPKPIADKAAPESKVALDRVDPAPVTDASTSPDTIGGTVVDENGQPIAGAEIEVGVIPTRSKPAKSILPADYKEPAPVKTDAQGRWQFDGVPAGVAPSTRANATAGKDGYRFLVTHPEFLFRDFSSSSESLIDDDASFRQRTAKLVLQRGLVMRGVVRDEAGQPIAGATIQRNLTTNAFGDPPVTADGQGRYEMRNARPGDLTVRVRASGFGVHVQRVSMREDTTQDFTLQKAQTLTLKIRDDKDQPVVGYKDQRPPRALVSIYLPGEGWKSGDRLWWSEGAHEDGIVVWEEAPAGELVAEIDARGYGRITRKVAVGGEILVKLTAAERLPTVILKVTDAATGAPLSGCTFDTGTVRAAAPEHYTPSWLLSGGSEVPLKPGAAEGEYKGTLRESHLSRDVVFCARREGYIPAITSRMNPKEGDATMTVALQKGQPTEITVRDAAGATVADAGVYVIWMSSYGILKDFAVRSGFSSGNWDFTGATGADGRCVLPPSAGDAAVLVAHPSGFAATTIADLARNPTLVLGLYAQVEANVKQAGKPVPGAKFEFFSTMELPGGHTVMHTLTATADPQGHISLPRVFPAKLGGFKEPEPPLPPGRSRAHVTRRELKRVPVGQTTTFELERQASTLRVLTGRLVAQGGGAAVAPRHGTLLIYLHQPGATGLSIYRGSAPVDDKGRFYLEGVPPGDYTLQFTFGMTSGQPAPRYAFTSGKTTLEVSVPEPTADAAGELFDVGDIQVVDTQK